MPPTRRRLGLVAASSAIACVAGLVAGSPGLAATTHARHGAPAASKRLPAGPSAFSKAPFTLHPSKRTREQVVAHARTALSDHRSKARVTAGQKFQVKTVVVSKDGASDVRFDRTYHGLPVYGGDLIVHLKPGGHYRGLETANPATTHLSVTPTVSAAHAAKVARGRLHGRISKVGTPHLAVREQGDTARLVWETVVRGVRPDQTPSVLHVLVDAHTGRYVTQRDEIHTLLSPQQQARAEKAPAPTTRPASAKAVPDATGTGDGIYDGDVSLGLTQTGGGYEMEDPGHGNGYTTNLGHATAGTGSIYTSSSGSFGNGSNSDPASAGVDAHFGAGATWDFYQATEGRQGIFNNGQGVPSRTHYGNSYVNAFWDGSEMTYGDGQNNARPLTELDVAGHEMSHGVSGALVGWADQGETGGLNEGTSDIFGTLVEFYADLPTDTPDYTMGELIDIYGNGQPLRYMYNPSLDGNSPNCYSGNIGNLDPHYALGPLAHWFFLLAVGSGSHGYGNSPTCDGSTLTGIGNDEAGKIWYKALASYANSGETYPQARIDSLDAAADLYGAHCAEYNAVDAAWAAVDVTGSDPRPGTCSTPPPGQNTVTVTSPGDQATQVNTAVSLQIQATDSDSGESLTYSATGLPQGLSINATSGVISGTPTQAGTSPVTVTAADSTGASGTASFSWQVTSGTPPPTGDCAAAWDAGTGYAPGDQVSYQGDNYTSLWYSTGAVPGAATSWAVWQDDGSCTG